MQRSLVDLLARSVRQQPLAEALVQAERRISYAELWRACTAVAQRLRQQGLQPGERVALLLRASPEYVAAYYGALAAGAVAVPLNADAKPPAIGGLLRHCDARFLISGSGLEELARAAIGSAACRLLPAADFGMWTASDAGGELLDLPVEPAMPATILYTSGTTGAPRGVLLSHGNLVSNVLAVVAYLRLTPSDRILHVLPFHYSYGNSVLHTHLAAGATVIIEPGFAYPHRILERMAAEGATGFSGVPATYALLLSRTRLDRYPLASLRYLTQAGGAMAAADILRVREQLPQAAFFVMYGQTEASSRLTYLPPERLADKLGSVGRPIAGTELRVVGADGQPLAPNQIGQVCVRGPGVMLGYWNDPDATRQVLRDGWLWTGDLGRLDEEGFLYLHGRVCELIKTGAHRVSPAEIEEVLLGLDGVAEAVAAGIPDPLLGQAIKVWLVPQPGARLGAREVLAHCRRHLPLYKVPKQVAFTAALPRTASGKIRRLALTELEEQQTGG